MLAKRAMPWGAVVALGGSASLAASAWAGPLALAVVVLLVQLAVASGWFRLVAIPGNRASEMVGLGSGVLAVLVLLGNQGRDISALAVVTAAGLAAGMLACLVFGQPGRERLERLTATVALVVVEVLAAGWIAAARGPSGHWVVTVGAVGCLVGLAVVLLGGTQGWSVALALGAAAAAGAVLSRAASPPLSTGSMAAIAAAAGVAAVSGAQVRRLAGRSARSAPWSAAALPLALAAPATFAAARITLG